MFFSLNIQFNSEGIKLLYLKLDDYEWCLKMKCTGCGEDSPNWHSFLATDSVPLKSGRGSANFLYKCKLCSRENSIDVVPDSLKKIDPAVASTKFVPLVKFDCRGLEPTVFQPKGTWIAESENSDTVFSEIDLTENDWADYDTNSQTTVGIYDFNSKFERTK